MKPLNLLGNSVPPIFLFQTVESKRTVKPLRSLLASLFLLVFLVNIPNTSNAQSNASTSAKSSDIDSPVQLSSVVVSATADEIPVADAPYSLAVIEAEDLRLSQMARTLPEALRNQPSVMVQKTAHGQGSPFIRGFTGFRTLLQVDGVRINNSIFREGPNQYWATVDPLSLKRMELVHGPGSTLYGSDAIGGSLNVYTYDREAPPQNGFYYRYSTAEDSHMGRVEIDQELNQNLILQGGFSYKDYGDLEGGKDVGKQKGTGYDEWDADGRAILSLHDDAFMLFGFQRVSQSDVPRTHKTVDGISWKGTEIGKELQRNQDQDRSLGTIQLHLENAGSWYEELHAGISLQQTEEARDRVRDDGRRDVSGIDVNTFGATLQFHSDSDWGQWVYGTDFYLDQVDSFRDDFNADGSFKGSQAQGPVADGAEVANIGLYVQNTKQLSDQYELILGGRFTHIDTQADRFEDPLSGDVKSLSHDDQSLVGSARILTHLDKQQGLRAFAGLSQGFRAPNLSDLTRLDSARSNEIETPSPDLDPEHFLTAEVGLKVENETLQAEAAFYHTWIDDMIVRTPTGEIIDGEQEITKRNGGNGYVQGVELSGNWFFADAWSLRGIAAWQDGEVDTFPTSDPEKVREPLSRLMPTTIGATLRHELQPKTIWLEAEVRAAAKADKLSTRDQSDTQRIPPGGTPSYVVGDLRMGWHPTQLWHVTIALENVADEDYRVHGSGLNEAGRNLVLATQYRF